MTNMTTAEVATALDTTPRTLRKFLRDEASGIDGVGKGSRYALPKRSLPSLRKRFAKWDAARNADTPDAPATPKVSLEKV